MLRSRVSLLGGLITGLTNRVGDVFFFLLVSRLVMCGCLDFLSIFLLVLTCSTKSALLPFSSWLPLAMCAPTPISSLVHSSTLVTAGIWLFLRVFTHSSLFLSHLGLLTLLVGGAAAVFSVDLKKIIAFSTLSHLGLMATVLGLGSKSYCFFHIICHGFIKASIFICVGTIIHSSFGSQEFRCLASLCSSSPLLLTFLTVSLISLSGLFFMTGFISKHLVFESFHNTGTGLLSLLIFYLGLIVSIAYSFRLLLSLFEGGSQPLSSSSPLSRLCFVPFLVLGRFRLLAGKALSSLVVLSFASIVFMDGVCGISTLLLGLFLGLLAHKAPLAPSANIFPRLSSLTIALFRGQSVCSNFAAVSYSPPSPTFLILPGGSRPHLLPQSLRSWRHFFSLGIILTLVLLI